jgi:hypothetical protein
MSEVRVNNLSNENNTGGPTISGITTYSGRHFFVPPQGDTASRPEDCEPGSLRFNTDSAKLEYFRGNTIGWTEIEASSHELGGAATSGSIDGRGTRAIFGGGYIAPGPCFNNTDAITIETLGNTIDFNNLTASKTGGYTIGNSTRSVYAGGRLSTTPSGSTTNEISFCNFSTQNDYSDSGGDLSSISYGRAGYAYALSSTTRGIIAGGLLYNPPSPATFDDIGFVTISSTGNTSTFGDLNYEKYEGGAGSSATRGLIMCGYGPNYTSLVEFITIATTGNALEFGNLTNLNGNGKYSASSKTRAVIGGGYSYPQADYSNTIEFVNIATTGDGVDFGDFINFGRRANSFNNSCNGHGGL